MLTRLSFCVGFAGSSTAFPRGTAAATRKPADKTATATTARMAAPGTPSPARSEPAATSRESQGYQRHRLLWRTATPCI